MTAKPSLRRRLARHVLVPLVATWAVGAGIVIAVAAYFAAQAFDRSLLDDAYELASHVRLEHGTLTAPLTTEEMNALLFDQSEIQYFAVVHLDGSFVAGHRGLPVARIEASGDHEFADAIVEGRPVRTVTLRSDTPVPFLVVMAQTTRSRSVLLERLLLFSTVPQAVLLGLLAWWLRRSIQGDLEPLAELQDAIERRGAADLAPLPAPLRDATTRDVERIAQAVDALLARLQESLQGQREFAGNVAHELRTPLAGIRAHAAFGLGQDEPRVWREQLEGIASAELRASRLVDQLLALARADEGSAGLSLEDLDLAGVAREVVLRWLPRARSAGTDLGAEGLDEPARIRGDRALVEGILNNLIDNALRHGGSAAAPRVTLAIVRTDRGIELSVSDNGRGLAPSGAVQLRKRWVRGDGAQRAGDGAGLGLSIVSRYAELLGAHVTLANMPEGGLRVGVEFPAGAQGQVS